MVRARGAPRALGRQIGEAAALQIRQMLTSYRELIESNRPRLNLGWAEAVLQARKYGRYAVGGHMEELHGMAEGAGALNVSEAGEAGAPCTRETLHHGGRIDCSTALAMADQHRVASGSIGRLMNLLGIRIRNCQLGCFQ